MLLRTSIKLFNYKQAHFQRWNTALTSCDWGTQNIQGRRQLNSPVASVLAMAHAAHRITYLQIWLTPASVREASQYMKEYALASYGFSGQRGAVSAGVQLQSLRKPRLQQKMPNNALASPSTRTCHSLHHGIFFGVGDGGEARELEQRL